MSLPHLLQRAPEWARTKCLWVVCVAAILTGCGGSDIDQSAVAEPQVEQPTAVPEVVFPERIRYGNDPAQVGFLRIPDRPPPDRGFPVVVLMHGGFWAEPWDYTLMEDLAEGIDALGIATWNIEFRRLRGRGGWPATFDDVRAAISHLEVLAADHRLNLESVVTLGHSSGGHLALWAARDDVTTQPPVDQAIGVAAITDLKLTTASIGLLGGTPSEVPDRWAAAAPSLDPERVTLLHGARDEDVPLFAVDNAVAAGVRVEVVSDADHFSPLTAGEPGYDEVLRLVAEIVGAA